MKQWSVGILLFNEVEVLDFAGPFEVFSLASLPDSKEKLFKVSTVAQTLEPIRARNGLRVLPEYDFNHSPRFDLLIVPGGYGAEEIELYNEVLIQWIKSRKDQVSVLASVCTGAFLLAQAGFLEGRRATTHWMDLDRLQKAYTGIQVLRDVKYVDEGDMITSGGISAGIDMSFYLVQKLAGKDATSYTAKRMEYRLNEP